jgi:hypothetical protein
MPISQLPQAPYRQDRRVYPTPIIGDVLFSEVRDCTRSEIPEYGTAHPNSGKWPDHKLVFVKTVDIERDGIFEFFYAAERENQDLYNFSFGNKVIGNREFRTVTRTYVTLRENFKPVDIEFGTPMPDTPEGKFDGVSYVFYDKEQQNTQQEELNSLFVVEAHSYVEAAVLDEQLSLSVEKQDPLPPKFRVLSPTTTTEELAEGEVTTPTLIGDQLAATEDQINTNLKRKRTVKRSSAENIGSLSGKQVTNVLQVADVVETIVPDGTTIEASALTVDGSVEPLGNGQSLQRVITAPELFKAESFSAEKPDLVPPKFRAIVPTTTEDINEIGTAQKPVLSVGELSATEQQQNKFVKRKSKTKRDVTTLPKSLTQTATSSEKQIVAVTETLQVGDTTQKPSATVDIESEALGDGTYVVRKTEVPKVFGAGSSTQEILKNIPDKFLGPLVESQFNAANSSAPINAPNAVSIGSKQINEFVSRLEITSAPQYTTSLTGKQAYVGGAEAEIKEEISNYADIETGYLVEQSSSTPLGGGKYLNQTIKVKEWPPLVSAVWDDTMNALSIQRQTVKDSKTLSELEIPDTSSSKSYKAVNKDKTILVEDFAPKEIDEYLSLTKTRINLNLPQVLKKIEVLWEKNKSEGEYTENGVDNVEGIDDGSVSVTTSGSVSASASVQPVLDIQMEQVWSSDIIATNYFYFVQKPEEYLSELNRLLGARSFPTASGGNNALKAPENVEEWPVFKTKTFSLTVVGNSIELTARFTKSRSKSISIDREAVGNTDGEGSSYKYVNNIDTVRIGPCLCYDITIDGARQEETAKITGPNYVRERNAYGYIKPTFLERTSQYDIPRYGLYAVDSRIEPYKWGYYKVVTTVVDADQFDYDNEFE